MQFLLECRRHFNCKSQSQKSFSLLAILIQLHNESGLRVRLRSMTSISRESAVLWAHHKGAKCQADSTGGGLELGGSLCRSHAHKGLCWQMKPLIKVHMNPQPLCDISSLKYYMSFHHFHICLNLRIQWYVPNYIQCVIFSLYSSLC